MKNRVLLLCCFVILSTGASISAEKMRVAIIDFQAQDIPITEAVKITELIRNEMVNAGKFIVIERAQMGEILNEQGFQQTGCTDITCAVKIGRLVSAKKILLGTVMKLSGTTIITGRIVDVENGVVEFSEKGVAESPDRLYPAVIEFITNLSARIEGKTPVPATIKFRKEKEGNIVENGSFEKPQVSSWSLFKEIDGWVAESGEIELQHGVAGSAFDGMQLLELDANAGSSVYQDIPTTEGEQYILEFYASPRPGTTSGDNIILVYWDGDPLDTVNSGAGAKNTSWKKHQYTVKARKGTTRLEFQDGGIPNGLGSYLDMVSLKRK